MNLFVGVTDNNWFHQLAQMSPDEVNFWKPGTTGFRALQPGELFLFKLHSPYNFITGGGFFLRFSPLPASLAWAAFEERNGVKNLGELLTRVRGYRPERALDPDPTIGCIVLNQPFFFPREEWIPIPNSWPMSTMQGKTYDFLSREGHDLYAQVLERLEGQPLAASEIHMTDGPRYGEEYLIRARLGQGGFKVLVTEEYQRRCSITGEKTLPVLQAAHIKPYAENGPHALSNGVLLRADMHILFDRGLLTITPDYRIQVSSKIAEQFTNGKLYYSYEGQQLRALPNTLSHRPAGEFLEWHNAEVFVA